MSSAHDRIKKGLAAIVSSILSPVDYFAFYGAKVVSQNGDGSLELTPDDRRMPGLSRVPIRLGIPGSSTTISAGARVMFGFADGKPSRPVVTHWESATVTALKIADPSATQAVVLGTAYRSAEDTMLSSLSSALTALSAHLAAEATVMALFLPPASGAPAVTTATAAATAVASAIASIASFQGGASGYLSTVVKVK